MGPLPSWHLTEPKYICGTSLNPPHSSPGLCWAPRGEQVRPREVSQWESQLLNMEVQDTSKQLSHYFWKTLTWSTNVDSPIQWHNLFKTRIDKCPENSIIGEHFMLHEKGNAPHKGCVLPHESPVHTCSPGLPAMTTCLCMQRGRKKYGYTASFLIFTSNKRAWLIEVLGYGTIIMLHFFIWGRGGKKDSNNKSNHTWTLEMKNIWVCMSVLTNTMHQAHWYQQSPHKRRPTGYRTWQGFSTQRLFLPSLYITK